MAVSIDIKKRTPIERLTIAQTLIQSVQEDISAQSTQNNAVQHVESVESVGDCISRQAAIDCLNDNFSISDKRDAITVQQYIHRIYMRLRKLPSAQPEIIRCKDCKWLYKYGFSLEYTECRVHERGIDEDDYCSRAERRECDE